jgi:hypothetical protein
MERDFVLCKRLRSTIEEELQLISAKFKWWWLHVVEADVFVLKGACFLKEANDYLQASQTFNSGLEVLHRIQISKLRREERHIVLKAQSRLEYYRAKCTAEKDGEESPRGLMCDVEFQYRQAALHAKHSKNAHLFVEFSLQGLQYLLGCSTYHEFLSQSVHQESIDFCQASLSELLRYGKDLPLRSQQVLELGRMTLAIRKGDRDEFNRAGWILSSSLKYGNPDMERFVRDRCLLVQISWMKTPLLTRDNHVDIHLGKHISTGISQTFEAFDEYNNKYFVKRYEIVRRKDQNQKLDKIEDFKKSALISENLCLE